MKPIATLIGALALAAFSLVAHAQTTRTDTVPNKARGEQVYMQMCIACHGVQGNSTMADRKSTRLNSSH